MQAKRDETVTQRGGRRLGAQLGQVQVRELDEERKRERESRSVGGLGVAALRIEQWGLFANANFKITNF